MSGDDHRHPLGERSQQIDESLQSPDVNAGIGLLQEKHAGRLGVEVERREREHLTRSGGQLLERKRTLDPSFEELQKGKSMLGFGGGDEESTEEESSEEETDKTEEEVEETETEEEPDEEETEEEPSEETSEDEA